MKILFGTVFNTILLVFCLLCLAAIFMLWPGKSTPAQRAPFFGLNIAHRGLHTKDKSLPENSLAAFEAAAAAGYGIELDVRLTQDGQVVVFHDDDLQRMCGVNRRVDETPLQELQKLKLHATAQVIPLLSDALQLVNGRVPLVVELKKGPHYKKLCQKTAALLKNSNCVYCVQSFDPRIVAWFKQNEPDILRGQLAASPGILKSGIPGILVASLLTNFLCRPQFIAYEKTSKVFSADLADSGALRFAWTVRPEDDIPAIEAKNDAVIFEFYTPPARYKKPQNNPPSK